MVSERRASIDLYWLPLGAGGWFVRTSGRITTTGRSLAVGVALLGCLLWSGAARADARSPELRSRVSPRVDAWVEQRMAAHATPGAAVAVVRDGRVVHLAGYGHADPDGTPVTPDTAFLIGSVSKPITAALVEQLVADGVLDWDEPVWPHLAHLAEQAPDGFEAATVEQLLTHTSGIGDYLDEDDDWDPADYVLPVPVHTLETAESFLPILDGLPRKHAPGERFTYCNGGYIVLAIVLGEISHEEKLDLLRRARAVLFPIDWPEPFGLVMIEALACGTPVVAFPNGSVPEILGEGGGFIADSIDAAVDAVYEAATLDRAACRAVFERRLTAERMAAGNLGVDEALSAPDAPTGLHAVPSDSTLSAVSEIDHGGVEAHTADVNLADPILALHADILDDLERTRIANEKYHAAFRQRSREQEGAHRAGDDPPPPPRRRCHRC
jgi:hypothetical protein